MKVRMIAVFLILFLAAWLPLVAQQPSAPQGTAPQAPPASTDGAKPAAACCDHHGAKSQNSKSEMPCCHNKDAKEMACCQGEAPDKQAGADCCKGADHKMCAKQNAKDCCAGGAGKSCCEKSGTDSSAAKACCTGPNHNCCHEKTHA